MRKENKEEDMEEFEEIKWKKKMIELYYKQKN